jgi:hypothetical protein
MPFTVVDAHYALVGAIAMRRPGATAPPVMLHVTPIREDRGTCHPTQGGIRFYCVMNDEVYGFLLPSE